MPQSLFYESAMKSLAQSGTGGGFLLPLAAPAEWVAPELVPSAALPPALAQSGTGGGAAGGGAGVGSGADSPSGAVVSCDAAGCGAGIGAGLPVDAANESAAYCASPAATVAFSVGSSKVSFTHDGTAFPSAGFGFCFADSGVSLEVASRAQDGTGLFFCSLSMPMPSVISFAQSGKSSETAEFPFPLSAVSLTALTYQSGRVGVVTEACESGATVVGAGVGVAALGPMPGSTRLRRGPWTAASVPFQPPRSKSALVLARGLAGMRHKNGE